MDGPISVKLFQAFEGCLFPTVATASGIVARHLALQGSFAFQFTFLPDLQA
jgi:hypothetical protein